MRPRLSAPFALFVMALATPATAQSPNAGVTITPVTEARAVAAGGTARVAIQVFVPPGFHVQSDRPRDPTVIPARVDVEVPAGIVFTDVTYPPSTTYRLIGFDEPLDVFDGTFPVAVRLAIDKHKTPGDVSLPVTFRYQACDDTTCLPPTTLKATWTFEVVPAGTRVTAQRSELFRGIDFSRAYAPSMPASSPAPVAAAAAPADALSLLTRFTIRGTYNGYTTDSGEFVEFITNAEAGIAPKGLLEGRGPVALLAVVFVGGLALNLTPCVLPMIPINLAIIGAGARSGRRGRGLLLGAAYGAAMAVVYGVLGLVVVFTAGTFGAINASAWFNLGIAALFVFLGLAMFDVVSLDFSRFSSRIRFDEKSRGSFVLAFGMGAVAALLAGACVAPVVVQVVVFASNLYAGGTPAALALPFVLGLGMATPWPIAGAGLAALPRPGPWMVRVKQAMGVFILATAAYYGYVAYGILASRWVNPDDVRRSAEAQLRAGWNPSLADGLRTSLRDGTPLFVDVWASWCKNCLVMDRTTLQHPDVVARLSSYTRVKFQAEDLDASPAREFLARVGAVGLPVYIILRPNGATTQEPPASERVAQP
jgi:thiol:disulfide interchange protein